MLPGVWYLLQNIGHFGDQVVGVRSANGRLEGKYSTDHARAKSLQVTRIPVEPRFVDHIDGGANYVVSGALTPLFNGGPGSGWFA